MGAIIVVFGCVLIFTVITFIRIRKENRKSEYEQDFELKNILLKQFWVGILFSIIVGYFMICFAFQK